MSVCVCVCVRVRFVERVKGRVRQRERVRERLKEELVGGAAVCPSTAWERTHGYHPHKHLAHTQTPSTHAHT